MHKASRFRLYPTQDQATLMNKTIGCSRFIFNRFLSIQKDLYAKKCKILSYHACSAQLPELKQEYAWLKEVDSTSLQTTLKQLDEEWKRFLKIKKKQYTKKKLEWAKCHGKTLTTYDLEGHPKFKSKKNQVQSYTSKYTNDNIRIEGN